MFSVTQDPETIKINVKATYSDTPPISLAIKTLSVNMTLNTSQVIRGMPLGINITATHNKKPVSVTNITLIYSQSTREHNTTDFQKLEKGIYFTTLNTTGLSLGWWKLEARVEKSGFEIGIAESKFSIITSPKKREYPSPPFLIIMVLATVLVATAIIYSSLSIGSLEEAEKNENT